MQDYIHIVGARQHNLKGIDVRIPRHSLVVITGLSGSGKSSLAFDTIYAEGQRRYVESLSTYARQFLERLQKPDVDRIDGLSPAIAIEQRSAASNPRSIVATTTEIYDFLRLLYAHVGVPHCPACGNPIESQSAQAIAGQLLQWPAGRRLMLLAPYVEGKRGEHRDVLDNLRRDGFVRARIDGEIVRLDDDISLEKRRTHTLEAVVDRLKTGKTDPARMTDSVELALRLGGGVIRVLVDDPERKGEWRERVFSEHLACVDCGISFAKLEPRNFSFNSPYGACETCHGLGDIQVIPPEDLIPDPSLSLKSGAIPMLKVGPRRLVRYYDQILECVLGHYGCDVSTAWDALPPRVQDIVLNGSGNEDIEIRYTYRRRRHRSKRPFEGIVPILIRRYRDTESDRTKKRLRELMVNRRCPDCEGARLKPEYRAVTVDGLPVHAFCALSVEDAWHRVTQCALEGEDAAIGHDILKEVRARLGFLRDVGLGYLTLDRQSRTLSGGEAQRIRLATQLGSALVGVLYILDEPSIGLHQRDNERLLRTLRDLRNLGNTVVVVEHDPATVAQADFVLDLGPGAGTHGGELVCAGSPDAIRACQASLTGQFLAGTRCVPLPKRRVRGNGNHVSVIGAAEHNLKQIDVSIPLGTLCCVSGVSGSGKSTLVNTILKRALHRHLGIKTPPPGRHQQLEGLDHIDKAIVIDQSPIGRTPRSNPATYTGAFDVIRQLFAQLPESRVRGYKPGRFSFNVKGGRCEACRGDGIRKIDMQFLPDVYVRCEACEGRRYNRETLNVRYRGHSIADVLDLTVDEGCDLFEAIPRLKRRLDTLAQVGLGYIKLGQPATTLSGGEAQRVKLANELAKIAKGHTVYIMDEPTTGLHPADVEHLLHVLRRLRDQNNTVLVIEHNLDVLKVADHIIDLGPEGGDGGGYLVAQGTPEEVARCPQSYTGHFLAPLLRKTTDSRRGLKA